MPTTYQLLTADGLQLNVEGYHINDPKGVFVMVHGFGEHIGRYPHVANFWNTQGYSVIGYDQRGHGKSGGKRGHAASIDSYLDDMQAVVDFARTQYSEPLPLLLWGHSMGGNVTLNYMLRRKPKTVKATIVTGPWVRLAFAPPPFLLLLGRMMRKIYPTFTQDSKLNADWVSRDAEVVSKYKADPLNHSLISASAGLGLNESGFWLDAYSGDFPTPLLIMHGSDDKLISAEASLAFSKRLTSEVVYKMWQGLYHEIHNDPEKQQVFDFAAEWVKNL